MAMTQTNYVTNTRNQMDATSSSRWSPAEVLTALGICGQEEWSGILAANPYYKFAQRAVTAGSTGLIAYTALNSGAADAAQTLYRILSITDGQNIYRQTSFQSNPLATTSNYPSLPYEWYDAGDNLQILPPAGVSLTITVNWTPTPIDSLAGGSSTYDFPAGHESIVFLSAAAFLLDKGGAETDAANILRGSAEKRRQMLYQDISRRAAQPLTLRYPDSGSEWGGY